MIKNPTYKFYEYNHLRADGTTSAYAVSSFAGKPVRAMLTATPMMNSTENMATPWLPHDAQKIAAKRCNRAYNKVDEAKALVNAAMAHLQKMMQYEADAEASYNIASYELGYHPFRKAVPLQR